MTQYKYCVNSKFADGLLWFCQELRQEYFQDFIFLDNSLHNFKSSLVCHFTSEYVRFGKPSLPNIGVKTDHSNNKIFSLSSLI